MGKITDVMRIYFYEAWENRQATVLYNVSNNFYIEHNTKFHSQDGSIEVDRRIMDEIDSFEYLVNSIKDFMSRIKKQQNLEFQHMNYIEYPDNTTKIDLVIETSPQRKTRISYIVCMMSPDIYNNKNMLDLLDTFNNSKGKGLVIIENGSVIEIPENLQKTN